MEEKNKDTLKHQESFSKEESEELLLGFAKIKALAQLKTELLPVIVQDAQSLEVLLLAYTNQEALEASLRQKQAVFWSTSRNELWLKGAASGDYLDLVDIRVNCEQNSLLYRVIPRTGGVCHTKNLKAQARSTCFYRRLKAGKLEFLER